VGSLTPTRAATAAADMPSSASGSDNTQAAIFCADLLRRMRLLLS